MSRVGIVTESSTVLPKDLTADLDIRVASLGYIFNNKVYRDYLDITIEEFWKIFPKFNEIPTTSAVSTGDFYKVYLDLAHKTKNIVCITMSSLLSATYKAAEQAAKIAMEENHDLRIRVIDTKTGSGSVGQIALAAARAAKDGKSMDEVIQITQDIMSRSKFFMVLESLKYIMKVGRAPDGKPAGPIPPFSPIMGVVKAGAGVLENLDRAVSIDEAVTKAIDMVGKYVDVNKPIHFLLAYPDKLEKCEQIKNALTKKYNCAEINIGQLTPSMLVSCGPMYILGFYD